MKQIILQEDKHYKRDYLEEILGYDILSDFEERLRTAVKHLDGGEISFSAVGLVLVNGEIIKCIPKYWNAYDKERFKQLIKVIERYKVNEVSNDLNEPFSEREDEYDALSMMLYLLRDYYENGLYSNEQNIIEINGTGSVLWDKTVNEIPALISGGRPFYPDVYTRRRIDDERDYIKRLQKCVLTKCSKELAEAELTDLFDLDVVELSDEEISDFGDVGYILYRLQKEMNVQFNSRKQHLLNVLYVYISEDKHLNDSSFRTRFIVPKFHTVWEGVCKAIFADMGVNDLIVPPYWSGFNCYGKPLRPDIVTETKSGDCFIILDAKYYHPNNGKGLPGVEDIAKQYLYQLALRKYYIQHGYKEVKNCFLLPENDDTVMKLGTAGLSFIKELLLVTEDNGILCKDAVQVADIRVRGIPADKLYSLYLSGQTLPVDYLELD